MLLVLWLNALNTSECDGNPVNEHNWKLGRRREMSKYLIFSLKQMSKNNKTAVLTYACKENGETIYTERED